MSSMGAPDLTMRRDRYREMIQMRDLLSAARVEALPRLVSFPGAPDLTIRRGRYFEMRALGTCRQQPKWRHFRAS